MNTYFYYLLFNFQKKKMNDPNIHVFFFFRLLTEQNWIMLKTTLSQT